MENSFEIVIYFYWPGPYYNDYYYNARPKTLFLIIQAAAKRQRNNYEETRVRGVF